MEDKISILVVEDESKIRIGLRDFLEFHGFTVTEAVDGLEAERIVEKRSFDLILLDLMLPKISGEQLCTKWRRAAMNTPIPYNRSLERAAVPSVDSIYDTVKRILGLWLILIIGCLMHAGNLYLLPAEHLRLPC